MEPTRFCKKIRTFVTDMRHLPIILLLAALAGLSGCRETHFLKDRNYRNTVQKDFEDRVTVFQEAAIQAGNDALQPDWATLEGVSPEEREALDFLYAYMPLADAVDYPAEYYLEQVRASFRTREEMGWNVPEREFRHFVLPIRVNNENLDSSRVVFYRELKPRIQGLSMADAILAKTGA